MRRGTRGDGKLYLPTAIARQWSDSMPSGAKGSVCTAELISDGYAIAGLCACIGDGALPDKGVAFLQGVRESPLVGKKNIR